MTLTAKSLSTSFWGWSFRFELDEIKRAYKAAREASDRDRERIEREWQLLEAEVEAGRASLTDEDENGQVVYDRGEHVGEIQSEIDRVLSIYREAFTIVLYHFWERQLMARMKVKRYPDDAAVFAFLKKSGIDPDEPELTALRLAANVAEHSEGTSADKLFKLRPDLFDDEAMMKWKEAPSHEHLKITNDALDAFFEAVKRSGPPR